MLVGLLRNKTSKISYVADNVFSTRWVFWCPVENLCYIFSETLGEKLLSPSNITLSLFQLATFIHKA